MQSFIAETGNFNGTTVTITGEEHHHATRSCRVKTGELIGVPDGRGKRDKDNKDEIINVRHSLYKLYRFYYVAKKEL